MVQLPLDFCSRTACSESDSRTLNVARHSYWGPPN